MYPMDCHDCPSYRRGSGAPACLKCDKYREILKKSVQRRTIKLDAIPQPLLEAIPDNPKIRSIIDAMQCLPIDRAVPLAMQYILGCTLQEIADYHGISPQAVDKKNKLSLVIIKELARGG